MSEKISALYNSVSHSVSNYWNTELDANILTKNKDILKIGNILNSLFVDRSTIEIPRLVVVGSQSSGKSSLLNSILGMDILPTGSNMVTRSPLQIELIQTGNTHHAVFGNYINGNWETVENIEISYPDITSEQKNKIKNTITKITEHNAGTNMNITNKPIYLRVLSPNVPNLSLVDLPGLTMVACTDRGQPKDIKEQIRNMVGEYIKPKKTLILAVMPARVDIEADIALDLIKEYDTNGERTIGVLTKIDLMNDGTDITNLLTNNISVDLQLKYGYFAIKNRTNKEAGEFNVLQGLQLEAEYFGKHSVYNSIIYKDRVGIPSLCNHLSTILIESIKTCLPKILGEINESITVNCNKLEKLGQPLPKDDVAKSSYVHYLLSKFCRKFVSILDDRGNIINSGRTIKDIFIKYREDIQKLDPFTNDVCSDQYILECIKNCEGNHMSFPSPPIEVLEQIMKDKHKRPINRVFKISKKCAEDVMGEIIVLTNILIDECGIIRFPNFAKIIKNELLNNILIDNLSITLKKMNELIDMQENYIWTEDIHFLETLNKHDQQAKGDLDMQLSIMRQLLKNYYNTVIISMSDIIPKCIMLFLIKCTQNAISSSLYNKIKKEKLDNLIIEYDEIHKERTNLDKSNNELNKAKSLIENIM